MLHDQKKPRIDMPAAEYRLFAKELPKWGYRDMLTDDGPERKIAKSPQAHNGSVFCRRRPGFDLYITASEGVEKAHPAGDAVSLSIAYVAPAHRNFEMLLLAFEAKSHWMRGGEYCASLSCAAEPQAITNSAAAFHDAMEGFRGHGGAKDARDAREIQVMLGSAMRLVPDENAHKATALTHIGSFLALCGEKFECELLLLRTNADLASAMDLVADKK